MPKVVDHDAQRERIVLACFQLVAQVGYAESTLRQIAARAGVSIGSLYHYFPDKSAILDHMLDVLVRRDEGLIRNTLPADADAATRLRTVLVFVDAHRDHLRDLLRVAMEVHRHEPTPERRARVRDAMRRYREVTADVLGVGDGPAATMATTFLVGELIHGLLDDEVDTLSAQAEALSALWAQITGR